MSCMFAKAYHPEDDQADVDPDDLEWEPSSEPEACLRCGEDIVWSDFHAGPVCSECGP